jgi:hypothetical protein
MAILALIFIVCAKQRKRTEIVVEEHRVLPIDFGMATLALGAKKLLVDIVFQVAGPASRVQCNFKNWLDVTIVAGDVHVPAKKIVVGVCGMVERRFRPAAVAVARVAFFAVVSVVLVIV